MIICRSGIANNFRVPLYAAHQPFEATAETEASGMSTFVLSRYLCLTLTLKCRTKATHDVVLELPFKSVPRFGSKHTKALPCSIVELAIIYHNALAHLVHARPRSLYTHMARDDQNKKTSLRMVLNSLKWIYLVVQSTNALPEACLDSFSFKEFPFDVLLLPFALLWGDV